MTKLLIMGALILATLGQARADQIDDVLRERRAMIAAVALLTRVPDKCLVKNRVPTGVELARFIMAYGHKADDVFLAEVKQKQRENDDMSGLPELDRTKALDFVCGMTVMYSIKVRDANK